MNETVTKNGTAVRVAATDTENTVENVVVTEPQQQEKMTLGVSRGQLAPALTDNL